MSRRSDKTANLSVSSSIFEMFRLLNQISRRPLVGIFSQRSDISYRLNLTDLVLLFLAVAENTLPASFKGRRTGRRKLW